VTGRSDRFEEAIARIDAVNSEDPNRVIVGGVEYAKEVLYARRMTERLAAFCPDASELLRLAVRAQHIARWRSPRTDQPEGRAGYRKWRSDLLVLHAELAGHILAEVGYDASEVGRVQCLIRKANRATESDAQTLEDVACLVFLEHYFDEFAAGRDDESLVTIVRKTWKKMSEDGRAAALKLPLSERATVLVGRALAS
jgi:Domain of unknown function (DUF4202)